MQRLSYIFDRLSRFFGEVAALLILLLVALVLYDALARYLFKAGSVALQELEWHLFALMFLLVIPYTLKHDKHVRIDLFYQCYSPRVQQLLRIVTALFFILPFSGLILWYGYDFMMMSYSQNEASESGGLPYRFLIKSAPLVAFLLLTLQALSEIFKAVIFLSEKKRP